MTLARQTSVETPAAVVAAWQRAYAQRLLITDLIVIVVSVYTSQFIRFGTERRSPANPRRAGRSVRAQLHAGLGGARVRLALLPRALRAPATATSSVPERPSTSASRMPRSACSRVLAIAAFLLQSEVGRGYLLVALPLGLALLLVSRWMWRKWLMRRRAAGAYSHRAMLMGERRSPCTSPSRWPATTSSGIVIVGAITERGMSDRELAPGIPVLGDYSSLSRVLEEARADTVVFTGADTIDPRGMRRLGWELEATSTNLIVAPALTDVAGPRIHARPVAGLPLIQVDYPEFEGRKYAAKRAFDLVVAFLALVVLSPVFLVIAVLVRRDSPGPAFFTQERVGLNGKRFHMLKFRSMVVDAEAQLPIAARPDRRQRRALQAQVRPARHAGRRVPAALQPRRAAAARQRAARRHVARRARARRSRPRSSATTSGRAAACSCDRGSPASGRPQGRSDLSWDDSVRLDLYYVENWSLDGRRHHPVPHGALGRPGGRRLLMGRMRSGRVACRFRPSMLRHCDATRTLRRHRARRHPIKPRAQAPPAVDRARASSGRCWRSSSSAAGSRPGAVQRRDVGARRPRGGPNRGRGRSSRPQPTASSTSSSRSPTSSRHPRRRRSSRRRSRSGAPPSSCPSSARTSAPCA